jgi:hypothetical protein
MTQDPIYIVADSIADRIADDIVDWIADRIADWTGGYACRKARVDDLVDSGDFISNDIS